MPRPIARVLRQRPALPRPVHRPRLLAKASAGMRRRGDMRPIRQTETCPTGLPEPRVHVRHPRPLAPRPSRPRRFETRGTRRAICRMEVVRSRPARVRRPRRRARNAVPARRQAMVSTRRGATSPMARPALRPSASNRRISATRSVSQALVTRHPERRPVHVLGVRAAQSGHPDDRAARAGSSGRAGRGGRPPTVARDAVWPALRPRHGRFVDPSANWHARHEVSGLAAGRARAHTMQRT